MSSSGLRPIPSQCLGYGSRTQRERSKAAKHFPPCFWRVPRGLRGTRLGSLRRVSEAALRRFSEAWPVMQGCCVALLPCWKLFRGLLGASQRPLGGSWGPLSEAFEVFLGCYGRLWGQERADYQNRVPGDNSRSPLWGFLGPSWTLVGVLSGPSGAILRPSGSFWGSSAAPRAPIWPREAPRMLQDSARDGSTQSPHEASIFK